MSQSNENVRYQVKGASGYSKKNFITRAGGATGVMIVKVTDQNLILTFGAFFKPFAKLYGILKTIPLENIEEMNISQGFFRKKLEVRYKKENGKSCAVVIHNTDVEQLKEVLEDTKNSKLNYS